MSKQSWKQQLVDFVRFETLLTPKLVVWLYVLSCALCVLFSFLWLGSEETNDRIIGAAVLLAGPVAFRVVFEFLLILFHTHWEMRATRLVTTVMRTAHA